MRAGFLQAVQAHAAVLAGWQFSYLPPHHEVMRLIHGRLTATEEFEYNRPLPHTGAQGPFQPLPSPAGPAASVD